MSEQTHKTCQRCGFDKHLWKKYRLRAHDWALMYEAQNGKCLGCSSALRFEDDGRGANVDHCHQTGKIRGLLCADCNRCLGGAQDRPAVLRKLAEYLEAA